MHFAVMLRPCCCPKRFNNLVFSRSFAHVAFMFVHYAFQTFEKPGVLPAFCACCLQVASMLFSKTFQEAGFRSDLGHVASMFIHVAFQNVSRTWCFRRFLRMKL